MDVQGGTQGDGEPPVASRLDRTLEARLAAGASAGHRPDPALVGELLAAFPDAPDRAGPPAAGTPYSRVPLHRSDLLEVMAARWAPNARCAPHDHGGASGFVVAVDGTFVERRFRWHDDDPLAGPDLHWSTGDAFGFGPEVFHDMVAPGGGVTLHVYSPAPRRMAVLDLGTSEVLDLVGDFGAWIPTGDHPRTPFAQWPAVSEPPPGGREVVLVSYTTTYRGGSEEFAVAARTLARDRACELGDEVEVVTLPLVRKAELRDALEGLGADGRRVRELHFVGHSGMYGPMFGSVRWPEQFSPHEWRTMAIPFAHGASAHFHACRTGRWFAPFFARTFGVAAYGNQNYTTVSARPDRFEWAGRNPAERDALYLVATPGRRSHGVLGSARKYGGATVEPMTECTPDATDRSYDRVADLYDRAYIDIRVREAEWAWVLDRARTLRDELGRPLRIAEVGCGNGAMLRALDDEGLVEQAWGFDASEGMIGRAVDRSGDRDRLSFATIDGPTIPLDDDQVDVVVSFLSFRYLDWDPLMVEVHRALPRHGRLWVVDMVEKPVSWRELPLLARSAWAHRQVPRRHPEFARDVAALTSHPDWKHMVRNNPIRADHEYRWYLESRFAPAQLELLTTTLHQRVVAFDSGPIDHRVAAPLTFP